MLSKIFNNILHKGLSVKNNNLFIDQNKINSLEKLFELVAVVVAVTRKYSAHVDEYENVISMIFL